MQCGFIYSCLLTLLITEAASSAGATKECYIANGAQYNRIKLAKDAETCFSTPVEEDAQTPCDCAEIAESRGMNSFAWTDKCELYYKVAPHDEAGEKEMYSVAVPLDNSRDHHVEFHANPEGSSDTFKDMTVSWTLKDPCAEFDEMMITKKLAGDDSEIPHELITSSTNSSTILMDSDVCRVDELYFKVSLKTTANVVTGIWTNTRSLSSIGGLDTSITLQTIGGGPSENPYICYAITDLVKNFFDAQGFCSAAGGILFDGGKNHTIESDIILNTDVWIDLMKHVIPTLEFYIWGTTNEYVPFDSPKWNSSVNKTAQFGNPCAYLPGPNFGYKPDQFESMHTVACSQEI